MIKKERKIFAGKVENKILSAVLADADELMHINLRKKAKLIQLQPRRVCIIKKKRGTASLALECTK